MASLGGNKTIKILFTCVGRRVELIQAFKNAAQKLNINLIIYGVDISKSAPALFFCNKQKIICRISDHNYISQLLDICKSEQINALIPTIDTDLLLLSQEKERFTAVGTRVIISEEEKIKICRNKRYTADYFTRCGLKSPIPVDDYSHYIGGFPAFIKPKDGSSSINAFKVENAVELEYFAQKINNYIILPFIDGIEYTVDIFCDFGGNPIYITPRERIAVRSGEVLKTKIYQDIKIKKECARLIADFKPCGPITVQLIRQKLTGDDYYIEINPRFGGGAPLSIKAGANAAEAMLRLLCGEQLSYMDNAADDESVYSRFDQSVCVTNTIAAVEIASIPKAIENISGIEAIIFDLDDTLYSEKEYVRSGYNAIASVIPQIKNAANKLWIAFENGLPAIDTVLKNEDFFSEELKKKCLYTYRSHIPKIHLYHGVAEVLKKIRSKGIKMGIITDGRPEGQRNKIKALGLELMVDEIIVTDELGGIQFRKPNDIAFRIMQCKMRVPFDHMIYTGDNYEKDFIAPVMLGMKSIWVRNSDGLYSCNNPVEYFNVLKWEDTLPLM